MEGEIVTSQNTAVHTDHGVSINPGPCAWGVHGRNSYLSPKVSRTYRREETYVVCPAVLGVRPSETAHNAVYSINIRLIYYIRIPGRAVCPARSAVPRAGSVRARDRGPGVWDLARKWRVRVSSFK